VELALTKETSTSVSGIVPELTIMLQDRRGRTRRVLFSMIREKLAAYLVHVILVT
jgi:hypothetical protein